MRFELENEVADVFPVEGIAGQHLPVADENAAQFVADILEFDKTQVVDRAGFNGSGVVNRACRIVKSRMRSHRAVQIALGQVAMSDRVPERAQADVVGSFRGDAGCNRFRRWRNRSTH